ncbi:MAG TPA: helix-hairpin-helix domain-containing protein [Candidatus Binatia bacterium]|nr:helix-hairpin-helix domain-containing protein [Candidatus Binatia bacterium]
MRFAANSFQVNFRVARRLDEVAEILAAQGANPYRVRAYRRAADTVRYLHGSIAEILREQGEPGLRTLPGIGESLARSIATLLMTGSLPMLNRLRGETDSESLLASVPGIGKQLAGRLRRDLRIHTLEQLEAAAHDGRLKDIAGIGEKKLAGIADSLATRLGRVRPQRHSDSEKSPEPGVEEILDVDREYRQKATAGTLPKIAPRRFNPNREAWLSILHSERGSRHYTALFSNTARAHEKGKTTDWVVLYCETKDGEQQYTVITSERGPLLGKRIVRGRELECMEYYYRQGKILLPEVENQASVPQPYKQPAVA